VSPRPASTTIFERRNNFSCIAWPAEATTAPCLPLGRRLPYLLHSLLLAAAQEGPKQTAVEVIQDGYQEVLVELKCCRKLQTEPEN